MPDGYRPVIAGMGSTSALWGEDSGGTDEPFTVLSPDGTTEHPDVVIVSIAGFENTQGGLSQAAHGVQGTAEVLAVDGADAIYHSAGTDHRGARWADLVVVQGDDLAVRVTSPDATQAELLDILEAVDPPVDRHHAPTLTDPPDLLVIGSVDVDAVLALDPYVQANTDLVPGAASAHVVSWLTGHEGDKRNQLTVFTLPGDTADLAALPVAGQLTFRPNLAWEPLEIDGRPAMASSDTHRNDATSLRRSVWMESAWGDIVVVAAHGLAVPSQDELAAIAASVRQADAAEWDEVVIDATGGPGLHADEGRTELARGTVGDLEWLLQDAPIEDTGFEPDDPLKDRRVPDTCLKLSDRTRRCAGAGTMMGPEFVAFTTESGPGFLVIGTTLEAASVQVTSTSETASAPLVPVPGGDAWAAVVFMDDPGEADAACEGEPLTAPSPGGYAEMRVDALDANGQPIGCLGIGPGSHIGGI